MDKFGSLLNYTPRMNLLENLSVDHHQDGEVRKEDIEVALTDNNLQLASQSSQQTAIEDPQLICPEHNKTIEGYCENDRLALCISCILSGDHKNHEITSISKAAKQERESLTLKFKQSKVLQDLVEANLNKIGNHQEVLKYQAQDSINKI